MNHVIAIPELAQRLGVDARTAEEVARDAGRGHRSRRSLSLCVALGRSLLMNLLRARCRKGSGCDFANLAEVPRGRFILVGGFKCLRDDQPLIPHHVIKSAHSLVGS